ncbi:glycoside hydrolase family 61 protein [Hypoxylon sp. CO27-5]|nr:glycoside hydrolase family 61 protein [Hypoxylon sp. CO27-5]
MRLSANPGKTQRASSVRELNTVHADDELGFGINRNPHLGHPGIQQVYRPKAPDKAADYDGSGGEYLLRAEGLALHAAQKWACAQFYVSCAQAKVVAKNRSLRNSSSGKDEEPRPLVSIPGVYSGGEPGVLIPVFWSSLTNYTAPGPAL